MWVEGVGRRRSWEQKESGAKVGRTRAQRHRGREIGIGSLGAQRSGAWVHRGQGLRARVAGCSGPRLLKSPRKAHATDDQ